MTPLPLYSDTVYRDRNGHRYRVWLTGGKWNGPKNFLGHTALWLESETTGKDKRFTIPEFEKKIEDGIFTLLHE